MSWFIDGQAPNRDEFIKNAYHARTMQFFMKEGESKELVFLTDDRFGVYEHKLQINGFWKPFTCSGSDCRFCGAEKSRGYAEYSTILDLTPFKDNKGKDRKYSRKALAAGKDVSKILEDRRIDCGGSLVGAKFRSSRTGDKSVGCGNDWKFLAKVDISKIITKPEYKPYDFREVLRPRSPEEQQAILDQSARIGTVKTVNRDDLEDLPPHGETAAAPHTLAGPSLSTMSDEEIPF